MHALISDMMRIRIPNGMGQLYLFTYSWTYHCSTMQHNANARILYNPQPSIGLWKFACNAQHTSTNLKTYSQKQILPSTLAEIFGRTIGWIRRKKSREGFTDRIEKTNSGLATVCNKLNSFQQTKDSRYTSISSGIRTKRSGWQT